MKPRRSHLATVGMALVLLVSGGPLIRGEPEAGDKQLLPIRAAMPGEVLEVGRVDATHQNIAPGRRDLALHVGDQVRQGQLLVVLWCKDLGEKKQELADALLKLSLDQETLTRLETLSGQQVIPARAIQEARRTIEADQIAVAKAERTLRAWRQNDQALEQVRDAARRAQNGDEQGNENPKKSWARVEVRAPTDGTIVEQNIHVGDVVSTHVDLFKLAAPPAPQPK